MAVFFRGLDTTERVALTLAMRDSGAVLAWNLPGPVLDKHSSGGIGDNVSLMLAPMVAACGGFVPMISGRGLGHTGGTLDKLDAIPGYRTQPDTALFQQVVRDVGAAIVGQTADLAPADKRLYAIRDVTATVESIGLITASILSKKLAAGLDGLVLDVKCGNGAFMSALDAARGLATSLVDVANEAGVRTCALITDMNEPLAPSAGNGLEAAVAVDFLTRKKRFPRLEEVTLALGAEMLVTGRLAGSHPEACAMLAATLDDGRAANVFARMVAALGGPRRFVEEPARYLPVAPVQLHVTATQAGRILGIDARALGITVIELGGGRARPDDIINPSVGLSDIAAVGALVDVGDTLAIVHAQTDDAAIRIGVKVAAAFRIGEGIAAERAVIIQRIGRTGGL
jgi:thymidine phosphorylase